MLSAPEPFSECWVTSEVRCGLRHRRDLLDSNMSVTVRIRLGDPASPLPLPSYSSIRNNLPRKIFGCSRPVNGSDRYSRARTGGVRPAARRGCDPSVVRPSVACLFTAPEARVTSSAAAAEFPVDPRIRTHPNRCVDPNVKRQHLFQVKGDRWAPASTEQSARVEPGWGP